MPSKSKKQHNLMAAVANNPKFAKKVGIPQSVGKEYVKADEGRKFKEGGPMKKSSCGTKKMARGGMTKMARGGMTKMARGGMAMGAGKGYKEGGKLDMVEKDGEKVPFFAADGKGKMARGGKVKMARGGKVRGAGMAKKGVRPCKMV